MSKIGIDKITLDKLQETNYARYSKYNYRKIGNSTKINTMGMQEKRTRAFESRDARYLLLKAPAASGKFRALMFLALDKIINQEIKKEIVAVPERSIGSLLY